MIDPKFEKWAVQEFESACACGVSKTPTAMINGVPFGLHDEDGEGLEELRNILAQRTMSSIASIIDDDDFSLWMASSLSYSWGGSSKLRGGDNEALSIDRAANLLAQASSANDIVVAVDK